MPRGVTVYAAGRGAERSWPPEREVVMKNKTGAGGGEDVKAAVSKEARKPAAQRWGLWASRTRVVLGWTAGGAIRPRRGDVQAAVGGVGQLGAVVHAVHGRGSTHRNAVDKFSVRKCADP